MAEALAEGEVEEEGVAVDEGADEGAGVGGTKFT